MRALPISSQNPLKNTLDLAYNGRSTGRRLIENTREESVREDADP